VFGQDTREHFAQGTRSDFDGTFAGFQAGADLLRFASANDHGDHIGFLSHRHAQPATSTAPSAARRTVPGSTKGQ
jgi:hypothetical protein